MRFPGRRKKLRPRRSRGAPGKPPEPAVPARRDPASRWGALTWLVAPLLALVAFRDSSRFEFVGDARFLIADNAFVKSVGAWAETLARDYFWSSSGQIIQYWRPITKLSWLLEWQWFGTWAGGYVWINVLWHAIGSVGVMRLATEVGLRRSVAAVAAVLYVLHPVCIEPVSLIMARSDVVVSAGGIWAVLAWRAWRRAASARARSIAIGTHVLALAVALGSKESAVVLPAVMLVWSVLDGDLRGGQRRRLASLLPSALLAIGYFVLRRVILERHAPGLSSTTLALDPLRLATGLAWYLRSSFPLRLDSSVREIPIAEAKSAGIVASTLITLVLLGLAAWWAARRRQAGLGTLLVWAILGVAPVLFTSNIAVPSAPDRYSLADRWLYFSLGPLVVAQVSVAVQLWEWLGRRLGESVLPRLFASVGAASVAAWVVVMLVRSSADRAELASDLALLDNEDRVFYQQIPARFRSGFDECRHEERVLVKALMQGRPADAAERATRARELCPDHPALGLYQLDALVQLRRFEAAEPVARRLLETPPRDVRNHGRLAYLAGVTLLERGDTQAAAPLFESAVRLGHASCRSFIVLAEAAKARKRIVEAAGHLEKAYQCGGGKDPSLRVAAATWLFEAGEAEAARAALSSLQGLALSEDQAAQVGMLSRALAR